MDYVRDDLAALYPQFGLRIAHAGLELAPPTDVELLELAAIVAEPGGVVAPEEAHYVTWRSGDADAARAFLERSWQLRVAPGGSWFVPFALVEGGRVVGHATLARSRSPGEVWTSSWIARAEQGRGLGRRVRLMLLDLAFVHLNATRAVTSAAEDNAASLRVSHRCGYRETHRAPHADGTPEIHLAVTPGAWRRRRLDGVVVEGVEPFLAAVSPASR
ncbi:GNAT family N-acetyltransferase [Actinomycetospora termitidis]|uniref:GNAT family protein n=1 Tax=Actinomycetospora termitidis TaxID=3053470 RepID=A0ABT7M5J9_9PSEU|nr:GNAT family protein [Actinomycetospora sp. Odt1-22]MDL5155946.1 GNAT family protein [Actinomycetospora sp. Odt1-22]